MADELGIFDVMFSCRAMRRIAPDPVDEAILVRLIEAAQQAPSGSNAQDRHWILVRDPVRKEQLAELNRKTALPYIQATRDMMDKVEREGAQAEGVTDIGPMSGWVGHQDVAKRRRMFDSIEWQAVHMGETPVLIVACLEFEQPPPDAFRAGSGAGAEVWPAVQNLLLAARALGLGAVPTTLGLADRAAAQAVLDLPETIVPLCLIPLGHPTGKFGPVSRRPVAEVMHWDHWGSGSAGL